MILIILIAIILMGLVIYLAPMPIDLSKDWEEKYRAEFMKSLHGHNK